jgi:hypothetical protein
VKQIIENLNIEYGNYAESKHNYLSEILSLEEDISLSSKLIYANIW